MRPLERAEEEALAYHTEEAHANDQHRQRQREGGVKVVGECDAVNERPNHDEAALGDIDHANRVEEEAIPQRDQPVDTAQC